MLVIGITGPLAAGKGTIVDYLVQKKGFQHFSVRAFLIQEIEKRGMPVNRDNMVIVGNDLRANYGSSYIIDQLYEQAKASGKDAIIESIRAVGEAEALKNKGSFYLFAVDAEPKMRYERAVLRASESDYVSYEKFIQDEQKELQNDDPLKQNISKCIQLSDHIFTNNGTFEELYRQIDEVINEFRI